MPHQCTSCGRTFADGSKEMLSGCPDCGGNKFQFMPAEAVEGDAGSSGGHGAVSQARDAGGTAPKKRPDDAPSTADASSAGDAPETGGDRGAVNRAAATVREWVGSGGSADDRARDPAESADGRDPAEPADGREHAESADQATGGAAETPEDSAQASARRDVVTEDELPEDPPETTASAGDTGADGRTAGASPAGDAPASTSTVDGPTSATSAESVDADSVDSGSASTESASGDGEPTPQEASDEAAVVDAPDDRNPGLEELREELNSQFESIRIENPGQYELNLMELYEREEYIISLQEDGKYVIEVPDAWDAVDR